MATEKVDLNLYGGEVVITFYPNSHQYKKDGKNVLSVSAISWVVDKSQMLMNWAVKLTREALIARVNAELPISENDIVEACALHRTKKDEAAAIWTLVHDWVEAYTSGQEIPMPENEAAQNGILAFLKWKSENDIEFLLSEKIVYSKQYNYVGKFDAVVMLNGKKYLLDYKTSNGFRPVEMKMQTAGYVLAYEEETGDKIDWRMIVRFDKETGEFELHDLDGVEEDQQAFIAALQLLTWVKPLQKSY